MIHKQCCFCFRRRCCCCRQLINIWCSPVCVYHPCVSASVYGWATFTCFLLRIWFASGGGGSSRASARPRNTKPGLPGTYFKASSVPWTHNVSAQSLSPHKIQW